MPHRMMGSPLVLIEEEEEIKEQQQQLASLSFLED
eukprot:CAMPEP_0185594230 /NCGR_PEP_ID=MMETSP0434-20130131/74106_1 /TAXON_ID=626734 ORGANISM="Favella taraikaensis, Strain Fe Narragansett Bay" /NCGR_SAMPLE_ID=MMETSP0434 /ASSEMBLY_ACC=CAM_ASM_000379 /LENGTH=34 /DNA_ID= /DNA_START= /DNA_END= /DNA_ORIENTATION=